MFKVFKNEWSNLRICHYKATIIVFKNYEIPRLKQKQKQ